MNTLAWNNEIGPSLLIYCNETRGGFFLKLFFGLAFDFVGLHAKVMINRDSWGYSYSIVRGEILRSLEDELLRKHLPRMFSLIKNES